ncbi:hypothetical protein M0R04_04510 [Candidatus Dojkabacteria bacterium]|jgi:hypothetical protein|nr:hypothetical protein [Candidatus Dojkabacteria bacterium]
MEPQLAGSKSKSTFVIDMVLGIILTLLIGSFIYVGINPKYHIIQYHIEQVCIENYKVIIKKDGTPHQLVDKFSRGIPCDDWETKK